MLKVARSVAFSFRYFRSGPAKSERFCARLKRKAVNCVGEVICFSSGVTLIFEGLR